MRSRAFSRAAQLEAGFFDVYLGWGRALLGAGKDAEAVAPLESPQDRAG